MLIIKDSKFGFARLLNVLLKNVLQMKKNCIETVAYGSWWVSCDYEQKYFHFFGQKVASLSVETGKSNM